jgi:hypothetical protein
MIAEYHEATRTVRTAMDRWAPVLRAYNITRSIDAPLLIHAAANGGVYASDFQQRTGCGNVSYLIAGLCKAGVLQQGPGRDLRYRKLTLTAKGREVLADLEAAP